MNEQSERTVLIVEHDRAARELIAAWLTDAGYTVLACPGPGAPDYRCLGSRGVACPLVTGADVVVLDLELAPDMVMEGTPARQLLAFYLEGGSRVVALSGSDDAVRPRSDERVIVLQRPVIRPTLLGAVRELVRQPASAAVGRVAGRLADDRHHAI